MSRFYMMVFCAVFLLGTAPGYVLDQEAKSKGSAWSLEEKSGQADAGFNVGLSNRDLQKAFENILEQRHDRPINELEPEQIKETITKHSGGSVVLEAPAEKSNQALQSLIESSESRRSDSDQTSITIDEKINVGLSVSETAEVFRQRIDRQAIAGEGKKEAPDPLSESSMRSILEDKNIQYLTASTVQKAVLTDKDREISLKMTPDQAQEGVRKALDEHGGVEAENESESGNETVEVQPQTTTMASKTRQPQTAPAPPRETRRETQNREMRQRRARPSPRDSLDYDASAIDVPATPAPSGPSSPPKPTQSTSSSTSEPTQSTSSPSPEPTQSSSPPSSDKATEEGEGKKQAMDKPPKKQPQKPDRARRSRISKLKSLLRSCYNRINSDKALPDSVKKLRSALRECRKKARKIADLKEELQLCYQRIGKTVTEYPSTVEGLKEALKRCRKKVKTKQKLIDKLLNCRRDQQRRRMYPGSLKKIRSAVESCKERRQMKKDLKYCHRQIKESSHTVPTQHDKLKEHLESCRTIKKEEKLKIAKANLRKCRTKQGGETTLNLSDDYEFVKKQLKQCRSKRKKVLQKVDQCFNKLSDDKRPEFKRPETIAGAERTLSRCRDAVVQSVRSELQTCRKDLKGARSTNPQTISGAKKALQKCKEAKEKQYRGRLAGQLKSCYDSRGVDRDVPDSAETIKDDLKSCRTKQRKQQLKKLKQCGKKVVARGGVPAYMDVGYQETLDKLGLDKKTLQDKAQKQLSAQKAKLLGKKKGKALKALKRRGISMAMLMSAEQPVRFLRQRGIDLYKLSQDLGVDVDIEAEIKNPDSVSLDTALGQCQTILEKVKTSQTLVKDLKQCEQNFRKNGRFTLPNHGGKTVPLYDEDKDVMKVMKEHSPGEFEKVNTAALSKPYHDIRPGDLRALKTACENVNNRIETRKQLTLDTTRCMQSLESDVAQLASNGQPPYKLHVGQIMNDLELTEFWYNRTLSNGQKQAIQLRNLFSGYTQLMNKFKREVMRPIMMAQKKMFETEVIGDYSAQEVIVNAFGVAGFIAGGTEGAAAGQMAASTLIQSYKVAIVTASHRMTAPDSPIPAVPLSKTENQLETTRRIRLITQLWQQDLDRLKDYKLGCDQDIRDLQKWVENKDFSLTEEEKESLASDFAEKSEHLTTEDVLETASFPGEDGGYDFEEAESSLSEAHEAYIRCQEVQESLQKPGGGSMTQSELRQIEEEMLADFVDGDEVAKELLLTDFKTHEERQKAAEKHNIKRFGKGGGKSSMVRMLALFAHFEFAADQRFDKLINQCSKARKLLLEEKGYDASEHSDGLKKCRQMRKIASDMIDPPADKRHRIFEGCQTVRNKTLDKPWDVNRSPDIERSKTVDGQTIYNFGDSNKETNLTWEVAQDKINDHYSTYLDLNYQYMDQAKFGDGKKICAEKCLIPNQRQDEIKNEVMARLLVESFFGIDASSGL